MQSQLTTRSHLHVQAFEEVYKREFGFVLENRKIAVDDVRIRAMGKVFNPSLWGSRSGKEAPAFISLLASCI